MIMWSASRSVSRNIMHLMKERVTLFFVFVGWYLSHISSALTFVFFLIILTLTFNRYVYYALAALGRQEILWWKKYLTQMQMIQFVLIFMHAVYFLTNTSCTWPKIFPALEACHGLLFFYLFYSFYRRNYTSSSPADSSSCSSAATGAIRKANSLNNGSSSSSCVKDKKFS